MSSYVQKYMRDYWKCKYLFKFSEKISVSQELIWKCFLDHSFGYCNIFHDDNYREISNISRAKSQNLNASRLIL